MLRVDASVHLEIETLNGNFKSKDLNPRRKLAVMADNLTGE